VSCILACGLLSFIMVIVTPNCSVELVSGVVDDMGGMVDVVDVDDVGGVIVLTVVTDKTVRSDRAGMTRVPGLCGNRGVARVGVCYDRTRARRRAFR
jgi:hypothetical protein